jgi:ribosomal protein S18 acetylase RimI-like enzyme
VAYSIREKGGRDQAWVEATLRERWGATVIVSRGSLYHAQKHPALVAERDGERCGLVTYRLERSGCEILTLDTFPRFQGAGTALVEAVVARAKQAGCRRVWLVTSNDNLDALRFYQRRGFTLVAVHRKAVAQARRLKPSIRAVGSYGIPLVDEIELERVL